MTDYVNVYLKSRRHKPVTLPQNSNAEADDLIQRSSLSNLASVLQYLEGHSYLNNPRIIKSATDLLADPNSAELQDILRLRIAIQGIEQLLMSQYQQERITAGMIISSLQNLVHELEHPD